MADAAAVSPTIASRASLRERVASLLPQVLRAGAVAVVFHGAWTALVQPEPGTSRLGDLGVALLPAAAAVGLAALGPRLRPALAAYLTFLGGAVMAIDGGIHVAHVDRLGGIALADVWGLVVGALGAAWIAVAAAILLRPKAPRGLAHRWLARLGVLVALALTLAVPVQAFLLSTYLSHKPSVAVAAGDLPLAHEDVTLRTEDGLALRAWYLQGRNGAAVVVVPGSGGDRNGGVKPVGLELARHGYGVLLYDPRGTGSSEGRPEGAGWTWSRDVRAAVDFLAARREVERIGAVGLSTGAEVALESAAGDPRLAAVVADGAQARTATEARLMPNVVERAQLVVTFGLAYGAYRLQAGAWAPESLAELVPRISPRPLLLVSTGRGYEREMNRAYAARARGPVLVWELPDTAHTRSLAERPAEWRSRVLGFLDRALVDGT
jgi:pimeloyl-ACP methyl ester carboxylesterase